jgi:predicted O-methyltransferase YrrM
MNTFEGTTYRTASNWYEYVPVSSGPIRYLEIGAFYGANVISVANTYASHSDSHIVCVDPWVDYDEYPEYKGEQDAIYSAFLRNTQHIADRMTIRRGFSRDVIPTLDDAYFDIIYIDGNHEPEYVLEDAVLSFRKLKVGGYLIFDDYGWGGPDLTQRGIDGFLRGYHKRIDVDNIRIHNTQVFVKKTS